MPECEQQECCPPDPYAYRSVDAEDSQTGSHNDCPSVNVTIDPVSGSYVFFPSYVVLTADNEDAVIRYTIDGTDPDEASTLYDGPFEITNSGQFIKARAFLEGCSPGNIATALYQNPPFPMGLDYSCTTPDKVGTWGVWAPDGGIDSFWQLEFVLSGNQAIQRVEIQQLDASGHATTGIAYSTDSEINGVDAMPLGLFIGGVQQHTDYQSSLGTFGAATHTWDLYGAKNFSSDGGFWQLVMVLGDDSRITAIKRTNCSNSVDPTPCPAPNAPTPTGKCDGKVDVVLFGGIGQTYRLYYSTGSGSTLFQESVFAGSPITVEVTGLTPGVLYYFWVAIDYPGCGFQTSIVRTALTLPDPEVSISTNKTLVDPNESFTISWTSQHIGGATCGGCADGQVSINQGLGCKAGNAAGSQATSQATPGVYTYEITGCNACGTVTASVQVEVRDIASCATEPGIINIPNPTTFLCGYYDEDFQICRVGCLVGTAWNGQVPRSGSCTWFFEGHGGGCTIDVGAGIPYYIPLAITAQFVTNRWVLTIVMGGCGVSTTAWTGEKLFGSGPTGTYTRVSGCATGPATITVT